MATVCTNLEIFPTSAESSTDGKMTLRWKCNASNVKSHELYVEYFSVSKKQWVTDAKSTVSHQPINQWVTTTYTSPDAATASALHYIVRPLLERTITDAKGNEKTEQYYGDYATSAQVAAPQWDATASTGEKSKMMWQTTAPDAPTVTVSNATSQITVTVVSAANNRVGSLEIQRSVDGGSWASVKKDYRGFAKDDTVGGLRVWERNQAAWTYTYKDTAVEDGHVYRYRAVLGNMDVSGNGGTYWRYAGGYYYFSDVSHFGKKSAWSAVASYTRKPARPTNFKAVLASENSVALSWTPEGKTGDAYEVQWSSYVGINPSTGKNDNAWNCGAFDEISTMEIDGSASKATVAGLEKGVRWYFRVLRKNDAGSAWAGYVGSDGKVYATPTVNVPSDPKPTIARPTGLRLVQRVVDNVTYDYFVIEGELCARFQWTDLATLEDGASYVIEHSTFSGAWASNAEDRIDTTPLAADRAAYSGTTKQYTSPGLEYGKTHYFRVLKVGDGTTSSYATGGNATSDGYVKVAIPAQNTSLAVPTWGSVASKEGGRALVSWTGAALGTGESFQVQYTDYSAAFAQNSLEDIQEADLDESSGTSHKLTVSGLDAGDWWFRVRRRSESAVSDWTGAKKLSIAAEKPEVLKTPKALKAAKSYSAEHGYTVTVSWDDDQLEDGASYRIEHATRSDAWSLNVADAIDTVDTDGDFYGRSGARRMRSFENVEAGKTHYYKLVKVKDGLADVWANSKNAVYVKIDADASGSIQAPSSVTATVQNSRLVLRWSGDALGSSESFQVEYIDYAEGLENNDTKAKTAELSESAGTSHVITLSEAEAGMSWWARVRRRTNNGVSAWSSIVTAAIPAPAEQAATENLGAPTASQTLMAYAMDDDILLSWVHNSGEGSQQSAYQVEIIRSDGTTETYSGSGDVGVSPSIYITPVDVGNADGSDLDDGATLMWRVRTQGAYEGYWSPWSRTQSFRVFASPLAGISVTDPLSSYPLVIEVGATSQSGLGLPDGNAPLSCQVSIAPASDVETTSSDGTVTTIAAGETVWSGWYTRTSGNFADGAWTIGLNSSDVRLVGSAAYYVTAVVVTEAGMRAEASATFEVSWGGELPAPMCSASFDADALSCRIWPWCEEMADDGAQGGGEPDEPTFELVDGVTLSVWRVLQDGSTELVADGIANDGESYVDDPRCAFGTCTYRIVAEMEDTGVQSVDEYTVETPHQRVDIQFGSERVELKYNIEWAEAHGPDVELLRFHGRRHPVAHWGTQSGQTFRVHGSLARGTDAETLAKLRSLAEHRGPCFVREPTGLAWWASVVPTQISGGYGTSEQKVELEITRVEE